jgi:hypothetical protein
VRREKYQETLLDDVSLSRSIPYQSHMEWKEGETSDASSVILIETSKRERNRKKYEG